MSEIGASRIQKGERARDAVGHSRAADERGREAEATEPASLESRQSPTLAVPPRGRGLQADRILFLQRTYGNRQVGRMIAADRGARRARQAGAAAPLAVQRYAVGVPANADCQTVVNWLDSNSPYRPMWAKTNVRFNWRGGIVISGTAPDFHATLRNPGVTMTKSVDMPQWQPQGAAMQQAWQNMYSNLRTHESEHEAIAERWKTTLEERLAALDLTVSAANQAAATQEANRLVNEEWASWLAEHQAEQDGIDPFTAELVCPDEEGEGEQPTEGEGGPEAAQPTEGGGESGEGSVFSRLWSKVTDWFA